MPLPIRVWLGAIAVTGTLLETMNGRVFESVPLALTAIWAVPADVKSDGGSVAAICAACTRVGVMGALPPYGAVQRSVDPAAKPDPLMVSEVAGLP